MNKIKILYLIPSLESGGTEKHLLQLAMNLNRNYFNIHIMCLSEYKHNYVFDKYLKNIGLNVNYFDMSKKTNIFRAIYFINKNKINIIHSLSYGAIIYDFIFFIFSKANKFITVRRNMQHHRGLFTNLKWFEKLRNKFTNIIVANSYQVGEYALQLEDFDVSKLKIIYNGIESTIAFNIEMIEDIKSKISYTEDDFIISNIANIKPVKRQDDLLKLINILKSSNKTYKLILIGDGDGPYSKLLRNMIVELKIENHVFMLPYIENVMDVLSISNIMILSSSAEGFSNAILESYKCGIPVVATYVGGNIEIVDQEYLYEVGNLNQLKKIIENISCQVITKNKLYFQNKAKYFSLETMIKKHEDIYISIIKDGL